jgi:hypothetical protein
MKINQAPSKTQPIQGFWDWVFGDRKEGTGTSG